jgi:hypothetical protein
VGLAGGKPVKIPNSRAAAEKVDERLDPVYKMREWVEPTEPGPIHAWLYAANPGPPTTDNRWAAQSEAKSDARMRDFILAQKGTWCMEGGSVTAACGRRVRVIYKRLFDANAEREVCSRCAELAHLWHTDVAEYDRTIRERNERWGEMNERQRQRELEQWDADAYSESQDQD